MLKDESIQKRKQNGPQMMLLQTRSLGINHNRVDPFNVGNVVYAHICTHFMSVYV